MALHAAIYTNDCGHALKLDTAVRSQLPRPSPTMHARSAMPVRAWYRMRERNRVAQRRYRNRQRFKLQESEQRVKDLTERVRELTTQKASRNQYNLSLTRPRHHAAEVLRLSAPY